MNTRQRADFEAMLIEEAIRRLKRQTPRNVQRWARLSQMTRTERVLVAIVSAPYRARDWIVGRIRP